MKSLVNALSSFKSTKLTQEETIKKPKKKLSSKMMKNIGAC